MENRLNEVRTLTDAEVRETAEAWVGNMEQAQRAGFLHNPGAWFALVADGLPGRNALDVRAVLHAIAEVIRG